MSLRLGAIALLALLSVTFAARDVCKDDAVINSSGADIAKTILLEADGVAAGLLQYAEEGITIGSTKALIPEASDASRVPGTVVQDGKSGDTDFPYGPLKPIATVGERSVCPASSGDKITGVPDGLGAYLVDNETVRVVVQSESYGPLRFETFKFPVNGGAANFTGSHVQYVDYDREMMSKFMSESKPASEMVVGMGELVETAYNLKGEMISARNQSGATASGAHFGNTDADGKYVVSAVPSGADWYFQSLCSAHMEQKHQWGKGIGLEDDIFVTNEEWHSFEDGEMFVGIGGHAVDVHSKTAYALGAFGQGGYEKITEINAQHPDYVMFALSGYNGAFDGVSGVLEARNKEFTRKDGKDYVWPENIVPFRIYVGVKGMCEDGSKCDDFLARNGLKYGQIYGFAIDMSESGPTGGMWRDVFHKDETKAMNGAKVKGKWIAQPWRWDGNVKNFQYDGAWEFQNDPSVAGYTWWTSLGYDEGGKKTEHVSPDPRSGKTAFIQTSTAGWFGHLYVHDVVAKLSAGLPTEFDGTYYVYQGELDVTSQIQLGGKGQYADGRNATLNWDDAEGEGKKTFEDIDGFEVFADGDTLYGMIQEDSGNDYGERMFITSPLEHKKDGKPLTYYFVAMSGGDLNTRMVGGVGIPPGVSCGAKSHEFSGLFDMSGLLRKQMNGQFALSASDSGLEKRNNDKWTKINDKTILVGLQAHNYACGVIKYFGADRGGQWLLYQPALPTEG